MKKLSIRKIAQQHSKSTTGNHRISTNQLKQIKGGTFGDDDDGI